MGVSPNGESLNGGKGAKKKPIKSLVFYPTGGKLLFWGLKRVKNGLKIAHKKTCHNFISSVKKTETGGVRGGLGKRPDFLLVFFFAPFPKWG